MNMKALPGSNETTVTTGAIAGACVTVVIWFINTYALPQGAAPITAEIGAALTVIATAAVQRVVRA